MPPLQSDHLMASLNIFSRQLPALISKRCIHLFRREEKREIVKYPLASKNRFVRPVGKHNFITYFRK